MDAMNGARALGVASVGIGLTEILAPQQLERMMGIENGENTGILRVLGAREIMHGVDILTHADPTSGVWARVAGDVLDTALFAAAARKTDRPLAFARMGMMLMAIGVIDLIVATHLSGKKAIS